MSKNIAETSTSGQTEHINELRTCAYPPCRAFFYPKTYNQVYCKTRTPDCKKEHERESSKKRGVMHVRDLKTSKKLQAVHNAMSDGRWYTVLDLIKRTGQTSIGTALSELRNPKNGCRIEEEPVDGEKYLRYRLLPF